MFNWLLELELLGDKVCDAVPVDETVSDSLAVDVELGLLDCEGDCVTVELCVWLRDRDCVGERVALELELWLLVCESELDCVELGVLL